MCLPVILSARPIFVAEPSTKSSITLIILIGEFSYGAKGPFGQVIAKSETVENPFQFQTKYYDKETGFSYYGYRYYDPIDGRWVNRDPMGIDGGINLYNSVSNNMVNGFAGGKNYSSGMSKNVGDLGRYLGVDAWGEDNMAFLGESYIVEEPVTDWAGILIGSRWIGGWGARWDIEDPKWSKYMKDSKELATTIDEKLRKYSKEYLKPINFITGKGEINVHFHAELFNGENVTGYNFLNGTNKDVGDFDTWGTYTIKREKNSNCYKIEYDLEFTWNDIIDPNPKYATDVYKSVYYTELTKSFLKKKPYDYEISIRWKSKCTVIMDFKKNILKVSGYPFDNAYSESERKYSLDTPPHDLIIRK